MKISKEQKEAIEYYQDKEISFGVNFDTEKLLRALGITEEDSFENHQIRFKTLLNLIEKLQKENEELKEYLITQSCEINRLNLAKIRLELSQIPDTTEQYKYLKNEYKMRLERTDFENYKSNYISIKKVKDKIEELNNNRQYLSQFKDYKEKDYTNEEVVNNCVEVLQELLESE